MFNFMPYDLRKKPTASELILWNYLRARQMLGLKFRRQHPLGPFIVDFVCLRKKIVIEVDGLIHEERKEYDLKRDTWLHSEGFSVIRIKNESLEKDREKTLLDLRSHLLQRIGF